MSVYEQYKPLRNRLRRLSLLHSLYAIWAHLSNLEQGTELPDDVKFPTAWLTTSLAGRKVFAWDYETLAKEIILNATAAADSDLREQNEMIEAVRALRKFDNELDTLHAPADILLYLARLSHRQFRAQLADHAALFARYIKVFSSPALNAIVNRRLGVDAMTFFDIGWRIFDYFNQNFVLALPPPPGVLQPAMTALLDRYSAHVKELRCSVERSQWYDHRFFYAFNPLTDKPLLKVNVNNRAVVTAPVPHFVMQRFTDGLYYEVCNEPGFADAFGSAFQDYIGAVCHSANLARGYEVHAEQSYTHQKNTKRTADWVVSDTSADLFVECKTKRLRLDAKAAASLNGELDADLQLMADFVVQLYKTIGHAKAGFYSAWAWHGRPIYPIVVTLEPWWAFGRPIEIVRDTVRQKLAAAQLDPAVMDLHPFTVCSAATFEIAMRAIAARSIEEVMSVKTSDAYLTYDLHMVLLRHFKEEFAASEQAVTALLEFNLSEHRSHLSATAPSAL